RDLDLLELVFFVIMFLPYVN
ncbi:hypothetical protein BMETH_32222012642183, partial [methanotrophic bacterial endosymbiont of Bathymodiolus sp.]